MSLGLAAALLSACGGGDDDADASPPSSTTTTAPTSTTLSQEEEVEAAYLAYWEMLERLSAAPDPNDPEIAQRATGEALTEVVDGLTTLQAAGRVSTPGPEYRHSVTSVKVEGSTAALSDCAVDDSAITDAAGAVVEGGSPVTGLLEVSLQHEAGAWKVGHAHATETWEGVTSCDR